MKLVTLGINAAFHDSAAALLIDGEVIAAAEEERFTRIKHAKRPVPFTAWELPFHAIDYCLKSAGLCLAQVDHVAYSYDPKRSLENLQGQDSIALPLQPSAVQSQRQSWDNPWENLFLCYTLNAHRQLADGAPHYLRSRLAGVSPDKAPYRFHYVDHHLSHQASAFLAAPFARCAVLTLDGRGELATTSYGVYRDGEYSHLGEVLMPHSLGLLYERITAHLGFLHSSDEYKVMALAALGNPAFRKVFESHIRVAENGQYEIDELDLTALCGPPRLPGAPLQQAHFDLAASAQVALEETVLQLCRWLARRSGESHLAMAGGVALNCVMNSRVRDSGIFDQVWIQPAAGDAGTALGAALWVDARQRAETTQAGSAKARLAPRAWTMQHAHLGPRFDDVEIESVLRWSKLNYERASDVVYATARLLSEGKIVAWFQEGMEFGPRALGARSILATPTDPEMQQRLNDLKDREDFRPVAPAVARERLGEWFSPANANAGASPFMLFVYNVLPQRAARIPAACHADGTARVQTVDRAHNPRFHALLETFGTLTGVPVLINTSFNVRGEPVVCTPKDAINAFFSTPIDALVMGSFIVQKQRVTMSRQ